MSGFALMDYRRLIFDRKPEPNFAAVDSDGVRRALAIVIGNAMKYTPEGGAITIAGED